MFTTRVLTPTDVSYLDTLFGWPNVRPVAAEILNRISQNDLSLWCLKRGIYQLPTIELIDFLRERMGEPQHCLEIGAGAGHIGRALGIRMSDNKMQEWPLIKQHYAKLKQPTVSYGKDVECLPALSAVSQYQARTVISCWVTEKFVPGKQSGNAYGVDEVALLGLPWVETYILVGNRLTHGEKDIFRQYEYEELQFDWLYSRSMERSQNAIWIFSPKP